MFEKEAEEYFETECLHSYADTEEQLKEDVVPAFQKGAEFGYNKAKADKWHILAENDNDVPLINSIVKVLTEDNQICESKYFYDEYFEEMAFSNVGLVKVLAWKELPKESE